MMNRRTFFQFSAPSNLLMVSLLIFPLVLAIWLSLNYITFSNIDSPDFIGLQNFKDVIADPEFWHALRFTVVIIVITVPAHICLGFVMAVLLDQITGPGRAVYLSATLIPMIVIPVVGTIVFKQLFEPSGLITWFFRTVIGQRFVFTESSMKTVIIFHTIWMSTPFALVVFFAGLQTLPYELVDASAIDGASRLQQIRHVVIPHLRSLFILNALIGIMDMFRLFDNVFVLTRMNPIYKADTILTYNFRVAMVVRRLGKGNAVAILTTVAIMIVLIPFLYYMYNDQIKEE